MNASLLAVGTAFMAFCGIVGSVLDLENGAALGVTVGFVMLALAEYGVQPSKGSDE